jgi:hypothetical protein
MEAGGTGSPATLEFHVLGALEVWRGGGRSGSVESASAGLRPPFLFVHLSFIACSFDRGTRGVRFL